MLLTQSLSFNAVGRFQSWQAFRSAIEWSRVDPSAAGDYLSRGQLAIFGMAALGSVGAWIVFSRFPRSAVVRRRAARTLPVVLLLAGALPWLPSVDRTKLHASCFLDAFGTLRGAEDSGDTRYIDATFAELRAEFGRITGTPDRERAIQYWNKSAGNDVIFFTLETGPARCLDGGMPGPDFPSLQRLLPHALVAKRHHSTYPYTNRATFSILASLYPSTDRLNFGQQRPNAEFPGVIQSLAATGYKVSHYGPSPLAFENDGSLYRRLGLRRQVIGAHESTTVPALTADLPGWARGAKKDLAALGAIFRDIDEHIRKDERYVVVYQPLIGHAPWPDMFDGEDRAIWERGREFIRLQVRWLGVLLDFLEERGRLKRTTIVFTADHGVRTRAEDPSLPAGTIDAYSFHVPLLIYDQRAFGKTTVVESVTSHIDIAPTVLDLLGIDTGREFEQGRAIWTPGLDTRRVFTFANHYFGADGYASNSEYAMWRRMDDAVYGNKDSLTFRDADLLLPGSTGHAEIQDRILRMQGLQREWVRHAVTGDRE